MLSKIPQSITVSLSVKKSSNRRPHSVVKGVPGKVCGHCQKWASLAAFNKTSKNWDGLSASCRSCTSDLNKSRYIKYKLTGFKALIDRIHRSAKKRGLSVNINTAHVAALWEAQSGLCAYTGTTMTLDGQPLESKVTVDRIDSRVGYTPDNVVLCTYVANVMKGAMTLAAFRSTVEDLHRHLNKWPTEKDKAMGTIL